MFVYNNSYEREEVSQVALFAKNAVAIASGVAALVVLVMVIAAVANGDLFPLPDLSYGGATIVFATLFALPFSAGLAAFIAYLWKINPDTPAFFAVVIGFFLPWLLWRITDYPWWVYV